MSHFYLTLPSNSSEKFYPDNTLTHFFTKLHNDVALTGEWEVGLAEIMYPRNWYNIDEQYIKVACLDCDDFLSSMTSKEVIDAYYEVRARVPSGYYNSVSDLVDAMNVSVASASKMSIPIKTTNGYLRIADSTLWPNFYYNDITRKVSTTVPPATVVTLSDKLERVLDIDNPYGNYDSSEITLISKGVCNIDGYLQAMYVYCDVLESVPVGDTIAPLLRIVEVSGPRGEMTHIHYDQPRYVPLQKKNFDSIEIDIRDDAGDPIPFNSGKLIVTLHFRRAKESYFLG